MTKEKLNLGAAFEKLKREDQWLFEKLVQAESHIKGGDEYKYPYAFGILTGAIKSHLYSTTDITLKDIDEAVAKTTDKTQGDIY